MSYFSRLTDIVTCNLSQLLANARDPQEALEAIIREIREGVEAARRSVRTAAANEERIRMEIADLGAQLKYWGDLARQELKDGKEDGARASLMRKREVQDLIAGIEQQHESAKATCQQLITTLHALEARLADAIRRRTCLDPAASESSPAPDPAAGVPISIQKDREEEIDAELAALKKELETSSTE